MYKISFFECSRNLFGSSMCFLSWSSFWQCWWKAYDVTIWRLENIGPNFFKFLSTLSLVNKVTFLYFFVIILITLSKDYGMYLRNVVISWKANEQSSANSFSIVRRTRTRKLDRNKIRRLPSGNTDYTTRTLYFLPFSVPCILPKYPTFPASIYTSHNFPYSRWPDWKYRKKKWKWKNFVEFTQR